MFQLEPRAILIQRILITYGSFDGHPIMPARLGIQLTALPSPSPKRKGVGIVLILRPILVSIGLDRRIRMKSRHSKALGDYVSSHLDIQGWEII